VPRRIVPLVTGEIYHVFNRGIDKQIIYNSNRDFIRSFNIVKFYLLEPPVRYSQFLLLPKEVRQDLLEDLSKKDSTIDLISYCFMPNHFHFLLQQKKEDGILKFTRKFQISYTKFFNMKYKRSGPLLQGQFKAVRIEDENQLLHISRYIHLNPLTSYIVENQADLKNYSWSSLPEYLNESKDEICSKDLILSFLKSQQKFKKFIFDQSDYQRRLKGIKHLTLE